ncbi:MAG: substrate-binding domain-containing protein [Clostridiales bacterium]|nr:substrate-binding domain-containing protein [Clostridiales bacterium]
MNRNRLYLGLVISVILAVIGYVSYEMLNAVREEPYYYVSVIVENSGSDRWNAFKEGLEKGTEGHNIYLNVVSTTEFAGMEEECCLLERELANGADGVIVEMCESEDRDGLFAAAVGDSAVVLVDTAMTLTDPCTTVATDSRALGEALAQAVINGEGFSGETDGGKTGTEDAGGDLSGVTIGILAGNQKKLSMQQRLQGFEEAVSQAGAEILWCVSEEEREMFFAEAEQRMEEKTPDVVAALSNEELEAAIDFFLENSGLSCKLYGEGRSEKAVYYLDQGLVQTLVVPNEYYMGYESASAISRMLEEHNITSEEIETDFVTVTKEEMYGEEAQRILFPIVR